MRIENLKAIPSLRHTSFSKVSFPHGFKLNNQTARYCARSVQTHKAMRTFLIYSAQKLFHILDVERDIQEHEFPDGAIWLHPLFIHRTSHLYIKCLIKYALRLKSFLSMDIHRYSHLIVQICPSAQTVSIRWACSLLTFSHQNSWVNGRTHQYPATHLSQLYATLPWMHMALQS